MFTYFDFCNESSYFVRPHVFLPLKKNNNNKKQQPENKQNNNNNNTPPPPTKPLPSRLRNGSLNGSLRPFSHYLGAYFTLSLSGRTTSGRRSWRQGTTSTTTSTSSCRPTTWRTSTATSTSCWVCNTTEQARKLPCHFRNSRKAA